MHRHVDSFCDGLESKGEDQVRLELEKMEDQVEEDLLDVGEVQCQNDNQESAPLIPKEVQELRSRNCCRKQRPSGLDLETESPGAQQADETFCQMVCRLFQEMLQRLKGIWQKVWAWVKEKKVALCSAMKSAWNTIESFFSSVAQLFQSFL